jgi:hypothetical protein
MGTVVKRSEAARAAGFPDDRIYSQASADKYSNSGSSTYGTGVVKRSDATYQRQQPTQRRTSYINSFLKEAGNFFKSVEGEINNSDGFNAAEFFERRKKQADSLKAQASIASQYLGSWASL